jgi:hypothetical protein
MAYCICVGEQMARLYCVVVSFYLSITSKLTTTQGLGSMSAAETLLNSCVRISTVTFLKLHTTDLDEI